MEKTIAQSEIAQCIMELRHHVVLLQLLCQTELHKNAGKLLILMWQLQNV